METQVDDQKMTKEMELVAAAVEAFRPHLPDHAEVGVLPPQDGIERTTDLRLQIRVDNYDTLYHIEVKHFFNAAIKGILIMRRQEFRYPLLLITPYVNPKMADDLKRDGLEFIDAVGNGFINRAPVYIFVKGNRPAGPLKTVRRGRAFQATGLKIIFAFLCNQGLENKPYREIADTAGVALGTIGDIIGELRQLRFILDMGKKGKRLINKDQLLQRWLAAYPEKLKPRLVLGRFRGEHDWWKDKRLDPAVARWGGEVAAAKLMEYLVPEFVTIYADPRHLNDVVLENRLRKDANGNVEVIEKFWQPTETWENGDVTHPILIYADLMATGEGRNIEAAKTIYDKYVIRFIRED